VVDGTEKTEAGEIAETIDLVKAYVIQETVGPLQGFARRIGYGLAGAMVAGLGLLFLSLALLRVLQTHVAGISTGAWSWVAYVIVVLFAALVSGLALWRISKIEKEVS
jgi:hypothetical protein